MSRLWRGVGFDSFLLKNGGIINQTRLVLYHEEVIAIVCADTNRKKDLHGLYSQQLEGSAMKKTWKPQMCRDWNENHHVFTANTK